MFLKIRYDYWLHLMAGYIITLTLGLYSYIPEGIFLTLVAAILKEIRDHLHPWSSFDIMDVVWTVIGIAPALIVLYTLK